MPYGYSLKACPWGKVKREFDPCRQAQFMTHDDHLWTTPNKAVPYTGIDEMA